MTIFQRLLNYAYLMRLHKPIGIWLLLWPIMWAIWIAGNGHPNLKVLIIFILGTVVMRSAGCVINDFADRKFDAHVARTKDRPLVSGKISAKEALILFSVLCLIALFLVCQLNIFTIKLSVIGLLLAIIYPFTKRFTHYPQLVLGLAFGWAVPMVFAAQTNYVPAIAWLLYLIAVLWPLAYDTLYAMVDREDDLKIGIKSTAIVFGKYDRLIVGIIQLIVLSLLIFVGLKLQLNNYYFIGLVVAASLVVYQQYLIKDRQPTKCFQAFLNNHWFGMIVFVGLFLSYL